MRNTGANIRIRQIVLSDIVPVVRIANQAFLETARLTRLIGYRFAHHMRECEDWLFVAETENKRVVGFIFGRGGEEAASVGWIAVHPDYWGTGIGGMLLKAVEDKARKVGLKAITTGTPFARTFYEKYGFKCIAVRKALTLELVGRSIEPPRNIEARPLLLDELPALIPLMSRDEYLRLLSAYFNAYESDSDKALIGLADNQIVGVVVGRRDDVYPELVVLNFLFAKESRYAYEMLEGLIYVASAKGHRWVGVELPVQFLTEEELAKRGWRDAQLPSFWTGYQMRKEL